MNKITLDDKIVVCKSCKKASCWHGIFFCDNYIDSDLEPISLREACENKAEHPEYAFADIALNLNLNDTENQRLLEKVVPDYNDMECDEVWDKIVENLSNGGLDV